MSGSGVPIFAATVISRLSLEKSAERFLSCAPLRYMMFLNLEWPAIGALQLRWLLRPRRVCLNLGLGSGRGYTARLSTKTRFNNLFRLVTASPAPAYSFRGSLLPPYLTLYIGTA